MKVNLYFSGCSCGCTPYERSIIDSMDGDKLLRGAAWFYATHAVHGSVPFKKCSLVTEPILDSGKTIQAEFRQKVEPESEKVRLILKEKDDLENQIEKSFVPPYTAKEGFHMPSGLIEVNEQEKAKFENSKLVLKTKKEELDKVVSVYRSAYHELLDESEEEDGEE